ncbi:hypothetical protein [Streptomyces sp. NRRL S-1022]|uniref:hypothetical protein n=1 Tax=Streptomyces sp. NRRL S-1022 TaxID=1463880 RepID=UPI000AA3CF2B|nr:hypothetical protein [Streptomyces sp. NRRL S-1022]
MLHSLCDDPTAEGYTTLDLGRTTAQDGQRSYMAPHGATWTTTRTHTAAVGNRPHARSTELADTVGPR